MSRGLVVFEGTENEVECWIEKFNLLRKSIKMNKWYFGTRVECMDLDTYKGTRFYECGKLTDTNTFDKNLHIFNIV